MNSFVSGADCESFLPDINQELQQKSSNQSNMDTGPTTFMEVADNPISINCQVNNNRN